MLKQKQVELELMEVKLAQKSVAVAQERENNMAERQCVSTTCPSKVRIWVYVFVCLVFGKVIKSTTTM